MRIDMDTGSTPTAKRPGAFARLFPLLVVAVVAGVWLAAEYLTGTNVNSSNVSMAKMGAVLFGLGLILLWALRMPWWRKRYVWSTVFVILGLSFALFRYEGMNGNFLARFVPRNWVQDLVLGGSADTLLERHRQTQGKADGLADLTIQPNDWPEYRGPKRDGIVFGPKIARDWRANPPKEVWRQPIGAGWAAFSIANGFLVTIEQRRDQEVVACYEAPTGKEVWTASWETRFSEQLGGIGPRATPTIAGGDAFAFGAKGRLVCLDGKNGQEKWAVETLADNENITWAMSGSPLVVDDLVIVNPGAQSESAAGRAVRAYDRKTGKEVWAAGKKKAGYSSPHLATLGGKKQVLVFDGVGLGGYDLNSGTELWRFPWATYQGINVAQPIVVDDKTVFIASDYGGEATGGVLLRIAEAGGTWTATQVWRTKSTVMRCKFTSPVRRTDSKGDFVYGLNDGYLECIDLKTGKQMWKDERRPRMGEGFGHGQILLCDDLIVGLTEESGELVLVEATSEEFRELGRIPAMKRGSKTWNNPAMAGGRVYIRNAEEMACYDLTGK